MAASFNNTVKGNRMSDLAFALPTFVNDSMTVDDQRKLVAIQATTALVASYLDYCAKRNFPERPWATGELQTIINGVMKTLITS
jgi:hypothetical protein